MEEVLKECTDGAFRHLLNAEELVLSAELKKEWELVPQTRGLKVNHGKTKLMVTGKNVRLSDRKDNPVEYVDAELGKTPCSVPLVRADVDPIFVCPTCTRHKSSPDKTKKLRVS